MFFPSGKPNDPISRQENHYRQLSRELGIPYFRLLNLMSAREDVTFTAEEVQQLTPVLGQVSMKHYGTMSKSEICAELMQPESEIDPPIKTMERFRREYPHVTHVSWKQGIPPEQGIFYYGHAGVPESEIGVEIDIMDEVDTMVQKTTPAYLVSKYWSMKPFYRPLSLEHFFNVYGISMIFHVPEHYPKFRDYLVELGNEYAKRLTEQGRAEAMEMEALGYQFSHVVEGMGRFVDQKRMGQLRENVEFDDPFMYSEFTTPELYLYYTLYTDRLFAFFQPVWHKFSDALREALVIQNFVNNPSYENMKKAVLAMDSVHHMSHTTESSFFADTYNGFAAAQQGVYTVKSNDEIIVSPHLGQIIWDYEKLGFDPEHAAQGFLGIKDKLPVSDLLEHCSPPLAELVRSQYPCQALDAKPTPRILDPADLEFSVYWINLDKIHPRAVDDRLVAENLGYRG